MNNTTTPKFENKSWNGLEKFGYDDVKYFEIDGKYYGKIVDIYDGDTCSIIFEHNNQLIKYKCRLLGINAAEMKPPMDDPNRDQVKQDAIVCRNKFIELVLETEISKTVCDSKDKIRMLLKDNMKLYYCSFSGFDKYGRLLVEIYLSNTSDETINKLLLDGRYAVKY